MPKLPKVSKVPKIKDVNHFMNGYFGTKFQMVRQAVRQAHGPEQSRRTHHPEPDRRVNNIRLRRINVRNHAIFIGTFLF
jgi:hypothetical protein